MELAPEEYAVVVAADGTKHILRGWDASVHILEPGETLMYEKPLTPLTARAYYVKCVDFDTLEPIRDL